MALFSWASRSRLALGRVASVAPSGSILPTVRTFSLSSCRYFLSVHPLTINIQIPICRHVSTTAEAKPAEESPTPASGMRLSFPSAPGLDPETVATLESMPIPKNILALYMRPLRRQAPYGIPVCNLQLRSYSVRNLEFFADFAMRAAYYLRLPAKGPVPLPRITERWTIPRSPFVFKKSQENFERVTVRRLIQIQDGDVDTVRAWLAYLEKRSYHGIGMKADVWDHEDIDVLDRMDEFGKEAEKVGREQVERLVSAGRRRPGVRSKPAAVASTTTASKSLDDVKQEPVSAAVMEEVNRIMAEMDAHDNQIEGKEDGLEGSEVKKDE